MTYVFFLILTATIALLIISLIKPTVLFKIFSKTPKRKTTSLLFVGLILLSFVMVGCTAPNQTKTVDRATSQENNKQVQLAEATTSNSSEVAIVPSEVVVQNQNNSNNNQTTSSTNNVKIAETTVNPTQNLYSVIKVVDGDTLSVNVDGKNKTIRLIGINTPETVDPRKPVECFGKEASNKAKELLTGKRVRLEADPTQGDKDKYNRFLRYVWLESGLFFNEQMISDGYAYEYTYSKPYKYQSEFKQAEAGAKQAKRGLWADGVCVVSETSKITPTTQQPAPQTSLNLSKYDCSSNKYNCSDFKTHDEAQAVFEYCGGSANDIHRLDGSDKDGLACESLP